MRLSLRSMITFTALGLVGAGAGGVAAAGQPAPRTEEPAPAAPRTAHGFVQILGEALSEVSVRPDQEAVVEALGTQIEPLQDRVDDAENALLLALAYQVAAGRVDRAALEPFVAGYAIAREEVSGPLRAAIERLHDIFDTEQREDFADAVESRVHDVRRAILAGERLDDLVKRLELTEAQKQAISEGLKQIAPTLEYERASVHRTIEGFRGDTFSVETYLPQSKVPERARSRAERIIDLTESIMNLLDTTQRVKLAERIREAAQVRADEPVESETPVPPPHAQGDEHLGAAGQRFWAAGVRRGPFGGVRGGVVVGGASGFAYRRAAAYPYAAGWGWGW